MDRDSKVGVIGAGAMGGGIAKVAATYGHPVVLHDTRSAHGDQRRDLLSKRVFMEDVNRNYNGEHQAGSRQNLQPTAWCWLQRDRSDWPSFDPTLRFPMSAV
jgi:3-hydroxyacyl-CoA dehydrogenase